MLGDNIKKYRKENNISQEALGEKLGVSRQSISLWENNQTQPSLENIVALAEIFNISTDDLLTRTKEENVEKVIVDDMSTSNDTPKKRTDRKFLIWILVAVCIICFAVALFFLNPWSNPFSENVAAIAMAETSVVKVVCYDHNGKEISTGSGIVLFHTDMIVTNYHVIEDTYSVKISTDQDITYNVSGLWHENENQDIAILKLEKNTDLTPLQIGDSSAVKKGETVTAIGSPLGIKNTVSKGNLSARIMQDGYDVLQFTAPISNGSSGGALFNEKGEVIGITFASFIEGQNLNLAIPIELVEDLYKTKSISVKPESFKDIYWNNYMTKNPNEYLTQTYGSTISVSFSALKINPEKYSNKMISVEGYVSSFDAIADRVRISMYISSQKVASSNEEDDKKYLNKEYKEHNLIAISSLRVGGNIYNIGVGSPKDKVLITGVFKKDAYGDYRIFAKEIVIL